MGADPRHSRTEAIFVGFAGRAGAGKTTAAKYLNSHYGFQYVRYSQILEQWLPTDSCDRTQLQELGWDIMAGGRQSELNASLIALLDRSRSAAIDGLRHPIDFESLSNAFGTSFRMIFLEARREVRFERLRSRFTADEALQSADLAPVETHIDSLKPLANMTISNNDSLERLHKGLDTWVATCGIGDRK